MNKLTKYTGLFILFLLLVLIRYFEDSLFYDPYLQFFKNDYLYIDSPRRETLKLTVFTSLRYGLNTIISLAIIYSVFRSKGMIKFALIVYLMAYVFLIAAFLYFVINPRQEDYYLFFNIRRFLIQPIVLLVLLPAFYFHRLQK